ncbi:MAG TPA: hypothetical protein VJP45_02475 [Candidatus Limnocylindria bacterium]|nr:hypothetical protein [Candidatus Limnocylindria bacterium]
MRRAIFASALALVMGLALGLLLTGTGPGASGIVGGEYWILVLVFASVYLGWQVAQLSRSPISLIAAPALVIVMVAALLSVKFARIPWAPLVGDGFEILVAIYAAAGAVGWVVGRVSSPRTTTPAASARIGLLLATVAVALSLATYAFASVSGS